MVVRPLDDLAGAIRDQNISLAILSVPADAAQRVADHLVARGILGIFNFAPMPLIVPPSVSVVAVDLSVQLEHLAYKTQAAQGGISFVG
jgi:redox-sensing transcriptional repressor